MKVGDIMETTGERIKRYREAAGLTQEELAVKIKISAQNIYKYEKGIIQNIPLNKIQALSDVFGITPTQLVGWGEDSPDLSPVENTSLSEDEKKLISLFRKKDRSYQKAFLCILGDDSQYGYEPIYESVPPSPYLRLASEMPPYRFSGKKKDK